VNLYFLQGISRKPKRGIKMLKGIKLNRDKNYSRGLQEATHEAEPERPPGGTGHQLLECSSTASLDCIYAVL
jgi:hypothetical protein